MKFKSVILAITLIFFGSQTFAMDPNPPAPTQTTIVTQPTKSKSGTYFGSIFPYLEPLENLVAAFTKFADQSDKYSESFENASKGVREVAGSMDKASKTIDDGVETLSHTFKEASSDLANVAKDFTAKVDLFQKDGVKISPESIAELNKTGASLLKTCFIGSIGGAIALSGIILFFKTLNEKSDDSDTQKDPRPLYKRILTNRYFISALLMAAGTGIILKSDKIVEAIS